MNARGYGRRRVGISELVGTMLTISITLVAGFAVFGYVNNQAGVNENQYGQAVGQTVQYLEERFVVAQISYNYNGCTLSCKSTNMTVYFYNDGRINNQFQQIEIYNSTRNKIDITFTGTYVTDLDNPGGCTVAASTSLESSLLGSGSSSFTTSVGSMASVTLALPSCYTSKGSGYQFFQGDTYFVKVLGTYGNTVTYFQAM